MNYFIYICRRSHVNLRDHKTIINLFIHHQSNQTPSHPITILCFTQFVCILPDTKAIVNIVIIIWIFTLIRVKVCFCNTGYSRAPPDPPRPRDRAKSHPNSSSGDLRRKNGRRSQSRRATIFQSCPPGDGSNHYIFMLAQR